MTSRESHGEVSSEREHRMLQFMDLRLVPPRVVDEALNASLRGDQLATNPFQFGAEDIRLAAEPLGVRLPPAGGDTRVASLMRSAAVVLMIL